MKLPYPYGKYGCGEPADAHRPRRKLIKTPRRFLPSKAAFEVPISMASHKWIPERLHGYLLREGHPSAPLSRKGARPPPRRRHDEELRMVANSRPPMNTQAVKTLPWLNHGRALRPKTRAFINPQQPPPSPTWKAGRRKTFSPRRRGPAKHRAKPHERQPSALRSPRTRPPSIFWDFKTPAGFARPRSARQQLFRRHDQLTFATSPTGVESGGRPSPPLRIWPDTST